MSKTEKRTTHQKRAIRDALYTMDNHPTASMVAEYLSQDGQKVSRATVFRVLSDAADEGSITRVQLMGEDVRYDSGQSRITICTADAAAGSRTRFCLTCRILTAGWRKADSLLKSMKLSSPGCAATAPRG